MDVPLFWREPLSNPRTISFLQYLEKGSITENNTVTVVKDLKYDLYAAVAAAKGGVSCVLDYTAEGENHSYLFCKKTRTITPLIQRK